ncbi:MAG: quinol:cytochrome C oxidoreductase, partial [Bacteroidota bacterium]
ADRAWANLLLNNFYFLSLAIGASFFLALQYITQSGWSAMFRRVPEAMGAYLPFAAILMLLLYFGMNNIYEWSHTDIVANDPVLLHKAPYLNLSFFFIRMIIFFTAWIIMTRIIRKVSLQEDQFGGMKYLEKNEMNSKIFIFILAITFSLASFDYIMSIEAHWVSTIFAVKNFVAAFYHGTAIIILIVILLNEKGYFKELNESHLLDFSRYLFMLSIVWGYMFFAQFMLIWFANIPEETVYYAERWNHGWKVLFYVNIIINWFIPFTVLLSQKMDKNKTVVKLICILLIAGQWIDLYDQIMPTLTGTPQFGIIEIGAFIGYAGLFALVVAKALGSADLVPKNHPYLEESLYHHIH